MKIKKIGVIFYFLIFPIVMFSASQDSVVNNSSKTLHYDKSSDLEPVNFNQKQLEDYKKNKDFNYVEKKHDNGWWQRFKNWISYLWSSFWNSILGAKAGNWLNVLVTVIKYLLIGGIVFFIVWLFIRLNPGKAYLKAKDLPGVLLSEDEKIIKEKDIPLLIEKAIQQQNYRLAIRYYYLLILKKLKEKELIEYQSEKTNQEYQSEIKDDHLKLQFKEITHLYDFVWYGDFSMSQHQFNLAQERFQRVQNQLKTINNG